MIDHKQHQNLEYIICLGSILTTDTICTREIKSSVVMAEAASNNKRSVLTSKLDLFKYEASKVLHAEFSFVWCWKLGASDGRSEIPAKL
jgi:tRNA U34 5-carboxymethylaminomethyl modifying GTPase MnmE/TrmE